MCAVSNARCPAAAICVPIGWRCFSKISFMVAILTCAFPLGVCGVCLVGLWWVRQKKKKEKKKPNWLNVKQWPMWFGFPLKMSGIPKLVWNQKGYPYVDGYAQNCSSCVHFLPCVSQLFHSVYDKWLSILDKWPFLLLCSYYFYFSFPISYKSL